ncbi:hypothetical protein GNI_136550 [Gregarina niphandrodes]|uniref:Uncharacterized protein n=1 Tax=Gregarina niphandrodes TaxID=110365 RepID=A0A023B0R7_GRENI|nr:hypothetical protein GNI_136550 [Gregarina niphandrodes]EZG45860.1 hypothetical protein GNI_136550 [Gregarina niphandrodes]|eukprot:XP_011132432.1 hypothetical protein GNI_136550 [Gregarina niphandrodes]
MNKRHTTPKTSIRKALKDLNASKKTLPPVQTTHQLNAGPSQASYGRGSAVPKANKETPAVLLSKAGSKTGSNTGPQDARMEFNGILKDIREISLPLLDKRARKIYMDAKICALGGKLRKESRLPLPEYLRQKECHENKILRRKEQERETNIRSLTTEAMSYREILRKKKERVQRIKTSKVKLY